MTHKDAVLVIQTLSSLARFRSNSLATNRQRGRLQSIFDEYVDNKNERLAVASKLLNRPIYSFNQIYFLEAQVLIEESRADYFEKLLNEELKCLRSNGGDFRNLDIKPS